MAAALNIAFEAPVNFTAIQPPRSRPIDLVHLARQTSGDKTLELEVLQTFARQTRLCMGELASENHEIIVATAHRLKGAARAVGANKVSAAAEQVEAGMLDAANIAVLGAAVVEAENFISGLCR